MMPNCKYIAVAALRTALLAGVIFFIFPISAGLSGLAAPDLLPEETQRVAAALMVVSLVDALVLAYPILRSRWHGPKLAGALLLVLFGAETLMALGEALFFNTALKIPAEQLRAMFIAGAIRALLIAPLAVLIFGKLRRREADAAPNLRLIMPWPAWAWRLALLPVAYVCLYFLFGYYVAWQSPEVRQLYSDSTQIKPFLIHMRDVFRDDPGLIPLQLLRGLLWIGLSLPIVRMMQGRRWETPLAVGLLCGLLLTIPMVIPNPYMPAPVRMIHFLETSTSTFLYGCLIGWVFTRRSHSPVSQSA